MPTPAPGDNGDGSNSSLGHRSRVMARYVIETAASSTTAMLYQDNDLGKSLRAEGLSTRGAASRSSASGGTRADFRPGEPAVNLETTSNTAPTHDVPVVWLSREGDRRLDALKWGLARYFPGEGTQADQYQVGDHRKSSMFKDTLVRRRRLVPAPVYFEWRDDPGCKAPFAVGRVDGSPVAFGGIWEAWQSSEGEMLQTLTKIFTDANNLLAAIQDCLPVIIDRPTGRRALARQKVIRHAASSRTQWRAAGVAGWQEGGQRAERRPGADQSDRSGLAPFQARI